MTAGAGPRSIVLRRCCLAIVLAGLGWNLAYQHDIEHAALWWVALLIYGTVIAAAVQHVYRDVRVGRAETAAMLASTVLFVLATLVAPRQVAVHAFLTRTMVRTQDSVFPVPRYTGHDVPLVNAPLLALFGHHTSAQSSPWLAVAYVLTALTMVGVCAQWWLVWRLGRHRAGVFNPAVA